MRAQILGSDPIREELVTSLKNAGLVELSINLDNSRGRLLDAQAKRTEAGS